MQFIKFSFAMLLIIILSTNCEKNKITDSESKPGVGFVMDKSIAKKGEIIKFTNASQNALQYQWNFGDGTTSTEINPSHQYTTSGMKGITLTAINDAGNSAITHDILIKEFTVMSYNIAFSGGAIKELYEMWNRDGCGEWNHDRRSELLKIIRYINPDILGLQEAFNWDSYEPPVYKTFADSLGMEYYYYPNHGEAEWNGICIYSKYPIISTDLRLHQPCVPSKV